MLKWLRDREERNERIGRLRVMEITSKKFPLQEKFNRKLDKFGSRPYIATNLKFRGIAIFFPTYKIQPLG